MGAVYAGWLTKSPEDRKGLFSLFAARQQWRRRYFVLYSAPITPSSFSSSCTEEGGTWTNHASSSSSSSVLVYYADETMAVQKGSIDLDNCEEIIDHVESCYYRYLFLLKTVDQRRDRQRTYYLAADSSDDVTHWVKKLHSTLNFYEDKLFTNTVLSITESGSDVTGIMTTVSNLEGNSESSKTSAKKIPVNESLTFVDPAIDPVRQLSHVHWLIVNSEIPHKCLESLPNKTGLCDANSGISVSKRGTKVTNQKLGLPLKPNVSAETRSAESISVETNSVESSPSSATTPDQSSALQNEASSGNTCTGQTGAKYCEDWPQFVKELLDDGDESQGTERNDGGRKGKAEGKSVFYVCNTSSFSPDTKTNPKNTQKGQRPNFSEATDEAPAYPSNQMPTDVTYYLRITKGSHRYKSKKKRTQHVASLF